MKTWALIAILVLPLKGFAHARLLPSGNVPPRSTNAGLKTGPCGGIARTATAREFSAGATITVEWEEVVNHPGRYEFYFSTAGDQNFQLLKTVPDTMDDPIVNGVSHRYSTSLQLPNLTCAECTLQMIQVMTEDPANPSLYYSCADIALVSGTPAPTPTPTPGPTPSANPLECH